MKKFAFLLWFGLVLSNPAGVFADYSGQWLATITESVNRCEELGKEKLDEYTLTIDQKANDIMILIMKNAVQRKYKGGIDPERPRNIHVQGTYMDDGGYVSELVDITFESDRRGQGRSVWTWSDGYYQCSGRFAFVLEKTGPQ